jgi:hypothetical protein
LTTPEKVGKKLCVEVLSYVNHPTLRLLEEFSIKVDNPGRSESEQPLIREYYKDVTPFGHIIHSTTCTLSLQLNIRKPLLRGQGILRWRQTQEGSRGSQGGIQENFPQKIRTSKCFATDGSKMENKSFVGFPLIDTGDGIRLRFRIPKIPSTFTAEALAIGETLEMIKNRVGAKFRVFLGLRKRAERN